MTKRIISDNYRIQVHKQFTIKKGYGYYAIVSDVSSFNKWLFDPITQRHPPKGHGFHRSSPLRAVRLAIQDLKKQEGVHLI